MKTNKHLQYKESLRPWTSLMDAQLCYLAADYFSSKDEDLHGSYMEESKRLFRNIMRRNEVAS